jgi:hypothetical protein
MNTSLSIESEEILAAFIDKVDGLHDALLHELVLLHPGYVNHDGLMFGDAELPNARLIFQSQFPDILAVRLDLIRVSRCRIEPKREFHLEGEIKDGEIILYLSGKHASTYSEIRAAEVKYTMLGREFLGSEYKLIGGAL